MRQALQGGSLKPYKPWTTNKRVNDKCVNWGYIVIVPGTPAKLPRYQTQLTSRSPHAKQVWVKALLESGLSLRAVCKESGLAMQTVMAIRRLVPSNLSEVEQCKKSVVGSFYGLARGCQENITVDKLAASSAYQLMGMASLAVTAARDMEGANRPVFNIVEMSINVTRAIEESKRRLEAIDAALISTQST